MSIVASAVLADLREQFMNPRLRAIGGGVRPRTTISDALVETFSDIVYSLSAKVVVEIGAHEASFSSAMKRRMPDADIIAIEANPHVHALYANHPFIKNSGIVYDLCAISSENGHSDFNIPTTVAGVAKPLHNMMGSLGRLGAPNSSHETISVRARTLDDYLAPYPGDPLAVWIDVEGAADKILDGAANAMMRAKVVICELETASVWDGQMTDQALLQRFQALQLFPIARDCQKAFQYNVILVKEELIDDAGISAIVRSYCEAVRTILLSDW